jgi:hypothetical protein
MLEREYNAVGSGNKEECNNQMILFADRTSSLVRYGEQKISIDSIDKT